MDMVATVCPAPFFILCILLSATNIITPLSSIPDAPAILRTLMVCLFWSVVYDDINTPVRVHAVEAISMTMPVVAHAFADWS